MSTNPSPTILTNTENDLKYRLLKTLSVKSTLEIFSIPDEISGHANIITHIIDSYTFNQIKELFFNHFSLIKQHIYIFDFKGSFNDNWLDNHPAFISKKTSGTKKIVNLLFLTTFNYINATTVTYESVKFYQPVQIVRIGTKIIIRINILERDISSLIKAKTYNKTRDVTEETILQEILTSNSGVNFYNSDINKGIKHLWGNETIDAYKVKYRKAKSITLDTMDEDNLYKKEYPDAYNELIKSPLDQSFFRYQLDDSLVNNFVCNPTNGSFSFSTFPPKINGIDELIELVINNN